MDQQKIGTFLKELRNGKELLDILIEMADYYEVESPLARFAWARL